MKICIISTFLGQKTSGAEISSFRLAEELSKKHDVFVITSKIKTKLSFKSYSLKAAAKFPDKLLMYGLGLTDFIMAGEISGIIKKEKSDIIHVQDFSILPAAVSAAKKAGVPVVMTVRDYRFMCNLTSCFGKIAMPFSCSGKQYAQCLKESFEKVYGIKCIWPLFYPWLRGRSGRMRKIFRELDGYFCVSDFVRKKVMGSGIPGERAKTILVIRPKWDYAPPRAKEETRFFCGGLLTKTKGFQLAIEAFSAAAKKNGNIKLVIAGNGSYKKHLQDIARETGAGEKIEFLGGISGDRMKEEYIKSDAVIVPSLWDEPLSRIIFESFTAGRPVIAANTGGSGELVKDGQTGWLVSHKSPDEMAEKILSVSLSREKTAEMGEAASFLIKQASNPENIIAEHISFYKKISGS